MTPDWHAPTSLDVVGRFAWGGMSLASNMYLPRLIPTDDKADVRFMWRFDASPTKFESSVTHKLKLVNGRACTINIALVDASLFYEVQDVGTYVADTEASFIDFFPVQGADPMRVEHYLVNGVMASLVGAREEICLHAACVANDQGAYVLGGPTGAGKSTLLQQFLANGGRLIADDVCVLRRLDERWMTFPTSRTVRVIGPDRPGWDNSGKSEYFAPSMDHPCEVSKILLVNRGVSTNASKAELLRSLCVLQAGWGWMSPSSRRSVVTQLERLLSEVPVMVGLE